MGLNDYCDTCGHYYITFNGGRRCGLFLGPLGPDETCDSWTPRYPSYASLHEEK